MTSIQEIRDCLVDMQVKLKDKTDTALFLLIEFMREGIRQFLTFTEAHRPRLQRQDYFDALKILREHLNRCLSQAAVVADLELTSIPAHMRQALKWDERHYQEPREDGPNSGGARELDTEPDHLDFGVSDRQIQVVGNGNLVAGGDIKVEGDVHLGSVPRVKITHHDYLKMLRDESGELVFNNAQPTYCHVQVQNSCNSKVAKGCQGFMRSVHFDGRWEDLKPFPLSWEGTNEMAIDIRPGHVHALDAFVIRDMGENYKFIRPSKVNTPLLLFKRYIPVHFEGVLKIRLEVSDLAGARGVGTYCIQFRGRSQKPVIEFIPDEWLE